MKKPNWRKIGKWLRRKAVPFFIKIFNPLADSLRLEATLAVAKIAMTMIESPGRDKRKAVEDMIKERIWKKGIETSSSAINLAIEEAYAAYKKKALSESAQQNMLLIGTRSVLDESYKPGLIMRQKAEADILSDMQTQGLSVTKSDVNLTIEKAYQHLK